MAAEEQVMRRVIKMQIAPESKFSSEVGSSGGHFSHVESLPPDAIFHTKARYAADTDSRKINLGIGAYRTEAGKPLVLQVVKNVEAELLVNPSLNKEYLPIGGDAGFIRLSQESMLGKHSSPLLEGRVAGVQTLSGTGALRVLSDFLAANFPGATIYKSAPTWGNHKKVFLKAGLNQGDYRYWDPKTRGLDINGMLEDLNNVPDGSIILLHACAHNPTGVDPTEAQWRQILQVVQQKKHLPFFDSAYQGYASGDLVKDAFSVRLFADAGLEFVLAQSFSKNLGLYGERAGCASVVCANAGARVAVDTHLRGVIRPMYSNPPKHGAYIVKGVLGNPVRYQEWLIELNGMSGRILKMRELLRAALESRNCPGTWNHITDQIGMFSFTGLTGEQVDYIEHTYHIFMLRSGRISMAGVSANKVDYIADAITDAVKNIH